jgi:zinc transporter 1/2/3
LGTTTDSFVALFIALCFHQFFEAIALGAQIANLKNFSIISAVGMVVFYALTTPVGIAIGIGIHSGIYNPKSVSTLLVTGILDSFAAGVLIYVSLVNLITAEMGANAHAFYLLRTRLKLLYYTALYLGVAAMAVIGRWA